MRPHNKSSLWDEYHEHYDRQKKYFNTKHKRAFCKRCIAKTMQEIEHSQEAQAAFVASGFAGGWHEWKYRQAFESVEAISGRSSNMQRHIRTCDYISQEDRTRIMEYFELLQAANRSSRELEIGNDYPRPTQLENGGGGGGGGGEGEGGGDGGSGVPLWSPHSVPQYNGNHFQPLAIRPRATSQSDDDTISTSSFPSPDMGRHGNAHMSLLGSPPPGPSPKLSLRNILNDDSESPLVKYNSRSIEAGKASSRSPKTPMSMSNGGHSSAIPKFKVPNSSLVQSFKKPEAGYKLATVESAGNDTPPNHPNNNNHHHHHHHYRAASGQNYQSNHYPAVVTGDQATHIESLSSTLEELRRENESLKRRVSSTENENGELKSKVEEKEMKLQRLREEFANVTGFEGGANGTCFGEGRGESPGENDATCMATPRATSAPALTQSEMLKKRKVGDGRASSFVPINK